MIFKVIFQTWVFWGNFRILGSDDYTCYSVKVSHRLLPFFSATSATGHCIGLPFTSQGRHPVIPPFNVPELAGWVPNGKKLPKFLHRFMRHPLDGGAFSRSVYVGNGNDPNLMKKKNSHQRKIYLAAPDSAAVVANVPIPGVRALVSRGLVCRWGSM